MKEAKNKRSKLKNINYALFWLTKNRSKKLLLILLSRISLCFLVARLMYPIQKNKLKNKNKTIISCTNMYYSGNSRAVFEYLQKQPDKYECYWIAKNFHTFRELKQSGVKVFYIHSLSGLPYFLKTDLWIRSQTGFGSLTLLPHKNYKVIQLWHGVSPKAVNHTAKDFAIYDAWCMPSEDIKKVFEELYNAPKEILYVTGYPQLDQLCSYLQNDSIRNEFNKKYNVNGKTVLYAPTWDCGLWGWNDPYKEFEKFCIICNKNQLTLILRLHPMAKINRRKLKKIVKKHNVIWLDMKNEPDTMKLLTLSDILITDWSSIYTDFYVTKRPVIFLEWQKKFFTEDREGGKTKHNLRSGEIVHNLDELNSTLQTVLKYGNRFLEEQQKVLEKIHGKVDGKASERVTQIIEEVL